MLYYQYIFVCDLTSSVIKFRKYISYYTSLNAIKLNFSPLRILCACINLGELVINVKTKTSVTRRKNKSQTSIIITNQLIYHIVMWTRYKKLHIKLLHYNAYNDTHNIKMNDIKLYGITYMYICKWSNHCDHATQEH